MASRSPKKGSTTVKPTAIATRRYAKRRDQPSTTASAACSSPGGSRETACVSSDVIATRSYRRGRPSGGRREGGKSVQIPDAAPDEVGEPVEDAVGRRERPPVRRRHPARVHRDGREPGAGHPGERGRPPALGHPRQQPSELAARGASGRRRQQQGSEG